MSCKDDKLIAMQCVSPGLGCTRLAQSESKPPQNGFYWQPCGLGERHQLEAGVGQPLLVEVSPHRRGDPSGWHSALCVFVNGELALGFLELSLSFYGRPNISDRFTFHFIRIQIFQIDFPLILYL